MGTKLTAWTPKASIYANVPRLLWITDTKVLGGYLGLDALLPLRPLTWILSPVLSTSSLGIGEPVWRRHMVFSHLKQFDLALGFGILGSDGQFVETSPSKRPALWPGLGYWTYMFTAGATWYPDKDKRWSVSALNRYEFNTEQEDTRITPGPGLHRRRGPRLRHRRRRCMWAPSAITSSR